MGYGGYGWGSLGTSLFAAFWDTYYGNPGVDYGAVGSGWLGAAASGRTWGTNPPYGLGDLLAIFPKFFGPATAAQGLLTLGSTQVAAVAPLAGIASGQMVTGYGLPGGTLVLAVTPYAVALTGSLTLGSATVTGYAITSANVGSITPGAIITGAGVPAGTTVLAYDDTTITLSAASTVTASMVALALPVVVTLSQAATASGTTTLNIYQNPPLPLAALQLYLNLAQASLAQSRWCDGWTFAMGLFVAHYATLYLRSETGPNLTAQQIALSGLERGIALSRSVGDVSTSAQLPGGGADWGTFQQTTYGSQLITMAKGIGAGPIWVP